MEKGIVVVNWTKKIGKSVGSDLGGEELAFATMVQPIGSMSRSVGMQVGGLVGAAISSRGSKKRAGAIEGLGEGMAEVIPSAKNLVVGITGSRMLLWEHGAMSGKPKELVATFSLGDIAAFEIEKGKLSSQAVMRFNDNSAWGFEVARMNNVDGFKEAIDRVMA